MSDPDGELIVHWIEVLTTLSRSGRSLDVLSEAMLSAAAAALMVSHGPYAAAERLRDLADRLENAMEESGLPGRDLDRRAKH